MAPSAKNPCTLATLLWLCALPALAQEAAPLDSATPAADQSNDTPATRPSAERKRDKTVLFLLPSGADENQAQLRDALLAQFALIDATLVFEPEATSDGSLSARLAEAQELAASHDAVAVFWLDTQTDGRWFLHMMDAQDERVIVRPVDASGERRPAAIEAVAVMTRSSARALLEDVVEPTRPAEPAPTEQQPVARPPAPDWLRLWLGYAGNDFARESGWQHGAELGAAWLGFSPFYGGLSFLWVPPARVASEFASFSIQRRPFAAHLGYRLLGERLVLDAELGLLIDWLHRPASKAGVVMGAMVDPHPASDGVIAALCPRLRAELRVLPVLGLYAGGGLDILLNVFPYFSEEVGPPKRQENLLVPRSYRPVAQLGVSFYP